ncbi:MAG: hypothetical protein KatS3mg068_0664 [Candidatus Sericytochromatia bacterium]|nr:MAG: hypothetical protein KatS3mg068_0664 [Candidatus Sericytochromatia bacterium]
MKSKKLIIVSSLIMISLSTACAKRPTTVAPYPVVNNNQQTLGDTQNFLPYQQSTNPNQAYYGNNTQLSDDTSEFNQEQASSGIPQQNLANSQNVDVNTNLSLDNQDIGNIPDLQPYNPNTSTSNSVSYTLSNNFPVDQDKYIPSSIPLIGAYVPDKNQWQAVGVAISNSTLYITAYDKSGLFKKGTVITMDSASGKNWKNLGSAWLGTRHPMDATVKGLAVDTSNNIFAADSTRLLYALKAPKYSVNKINSGFSSNDVAIFNGNVIVSTSTGLKKFDSSLSGGSEFATNITSSSGIGADNNNLYVVSGSEIKKVTSSGSVSTFVKSVSGAIDVASNGNNVFVLTSEGINMYDKNGKLLGTFAQDELVSPQSIACNSNNVFVADSGSSQKDSQILVYSNMAL